MATIFESVKKALETVVPVPDGGRLIVSSVKATGANALRTFSTDGCVIDLESLEVRWSNSQRPSCRITGVTTDGFEFLALIEF